MSRHYKVTAKERGTGRILTPEYEGNASPGQVIKFFGLEEPDIEWYKIEEITDNNPQNSDDNDTMD